MADEKVDAAVRFVVDNWEALGVTEHGGILHMPASIKRRNKAGGLDEVPVALRNVTNAHKFKSRTLARAYAKRLELELDRDVALVDEIENYQLLVFAIRDARAPYDQHAPDLDHLLNMYDTQQLSELWGRYNAWVDMLDPRFGELTDDQLWQGVVRIAREANTSFLATIPGYAQSSLIVSMAQQALYSPHRPSWLQPPGTFKQAS